jgi:type IV secretion system protein VirB2
VKVGQFVRNKTLGLRGALMLALVTAMTSPAYAQFEKAEQGLNKVQMFLLTIGGVTVTIAIMVTGYRMMFNAAQWKDTAPVFWGGILVGSATALSSLFF